MRTINRKKAKAAGPAMTLGELIGVTEPTKFKPQCKRPHRFGRGSLYNRECTRCGYREEKVNGTWQKAV
jgi:hypothetical protein